MNKLISNVAAIVLIGMLGTAGAASTDVFAAPHAAASVASATPAGENPTPATAG